MLDRRRRAIAGAAMCCLVLATAACSASTQSGTTSRPIASDGGTSTTIQSVIAGEATVPSAADQQVAVSGPVSIKVADRGGAGPGIDRVTVRNTSDAALDLSGWFVVSRMRDEGFTVPEGVVIASGESITIFETTTIGDRCDPDTGRVFFTCNALGQTGARTTRDVLFPGWVIEIYSNTGILMAHS